MTILFCVDRGTTLERLDALVRTLGERDHQVHVWIEGTAPVALTRRLGDAGVEVQPTRRAPNDHWAAVMRRVWAARDYVRTLDREWAPAPGDRHDAKAAAPPLFTRLVEGTPLRYGPSRRLLDAAMDALERSAPVSGALAEALAQLAPDVVVVCPALRWGSRQTDCLFAAVRSGTRSAVLTDGPADVRWGPHLRPLPDRLWVWNEDEAAAAALRQPALGQRVRAAGGVTIAHWTRLRGTEPSADAASLRARYVLYAGSDLGKVTPSEPTLAAQLATALKRDTRTQSLDFVACPHPDWVHVWKGAEATDHVTALVADARVVVGVQTRLLLEAAVAGRPVVAVDSVVVDRSVPRSKRLEPALAVLPTARTLPEAVALIAAAVAGDVSAGATTHLWRPHGDPVFDTVSAIETLAALPAPQRRGSGAAIVLRPLVGVPVAVRRAADARRRWSKESQRFVRKTRDRAARHVRRGLRGLAERRLAMRAFVLGTGEDREVVELEAARVARETVTDLARSGHPIVVGPWLSEAGFELLYWIPFVRWAKTYGNIREDRLIVVSRGGAAVWYADIASHYVDLLSLYGVDEFRARNDARIDQQGGQKQRGRSDFEREIFDRTLHAAGVSRAGWLHPSLMYNLFNLFWMQRAPASLVQRFTVHRRLPSTDDELPPDLPPRYIAAKFYTNASFPDTAENRQFVNQLLHRLTRQHDVVLLNTGMAIDEHGEFAPAESRRIYPVAARLRPADNLRLQTRIVSAADAYVGTYGGFSYMAPLAGIDAVTFFSDPAAFRHDHLEMAKRVFEDVGGGRFLAACTSELPFLETMLGGRRGSRVAAAS